MTSKSNIQITPGTRLYLDASSTRGLTSRQARTRYACATCGRSFAREARPEYCPACGSAAERIETHATTIVTDKQLRRRGTAITANRLKALWRRAGTEIIAGSAYLVAPDRVTDVERTVADAQAEAATFARDARAAGHPEMRVSVAVLSLEMGNLADLPEWADYIMSQIAGAAVALYNALAEGRDKAECQTALQAARRIRPALHGETRRRFDRALDCAEAARSALTQAVRDSGLGRKSTGETAQEREAREARICDIRAEAAQSLDLDAIDRFIDSLYDDDVVETAA